MRDDPLFMGLMLMELGGSLDRLADLVGARPLAGAVRGCDGEIVHPAYGQTVHGR